MLIEDFVYCVHSMHYHYCIVVATRVLQQAGGTVDGTTGPWRDAVGGGRTGVPLLCSQCGRALGRDQVDESTAVLLESVGLI